MKYKPTKPTKTKPTKTTKFSKHQMRLLIRPMFSSTIAFGYATPKQVEIFLDEIFGKIEEISQ